LFFFQPTSFGPTATMRTLPRSLSSLPSRRTHALIVGTARAAALARGSGATAVHSRPTSTMGAKPKAT
jgi:hypothetical protein